MLSTPSTPLPFRVAGVRDEPAGQSIVSGSDLSREGTEQKGVRCAVLEEMDRKCPSLPRDTQREVAGGEAISMREGRVRCNQHCRTGAGGGCGDSGGEGCRAAVRSPGSS